MPGHMPGAWARIMKLSCWLALISREGREGRPSSEKGGGEEWWMAVGERGERS